MRYVQGVGSTVFGKSKVSSASLATQAIASALSDAQLNLQDIDAFFISNLDLTSGDERQRHHASRLRSLLSIDKPMYQLPAACAGGGSAFHAAMHAQYDRVLVLGVDKLSSVPSSVIQEEYLIAADQWWEQPQGMIFPAQAALVTQLYGQKYGLSTDTLTNIAVKNHRNAFLNPYAAFYQKQVTKEQIESSPIVASPLRKHDCAPTVDGAAAVIIGNDKTSIICPASAQSHDTLTFWERGSDPHFVATQKAMHKIQLKTDISAKQVDAIELHDAFTIMELIAYEDLGLTKPGQGSHIDQKQQQKINLSGGLKAKGHPVSATGIGQIVDAVTMLKSGHAKSVLTHNMGGMGGTVVVSLFKQC